MFWDALWGSGVFWEVLGSLGVLGCFGAFGGFWDVTGELWEVLVGSGMFREVLGCLGRFWDVLGVLVLLGFRFTGGSDRAGPSGAKAPEGLAYPYDGCRGSLRDPCVLRGTEGSPRPIFNFEGADGVADVVPARTTQQAY
ncbi:hypothetical protein E2C01_051987 [Portunus trituberculatus]|uniref:Uncharacterized protein n=1 Tax=Portunus trituberculatus TaxID=210409 RepID=A0A5B7GKS3_PORTR|nr:hypothetical protein [Portunus trituberculatus]